MNIRAVYAAANDDEKAPEARAAWRLRGATGIAGLGFFLVITQPGLHSTLLGLASGLTSALTTGLKLRDAISSWLPVRKTAVP